MTFKALCDDSKQSMKPCLSVFENLLLLKLKTLTYDFEGHDLNENRSPILILLAHTSICLRNDTIIKCFDSNIIGDQNKLSVIKAFDNCIISKADVWAMNLLSVEWKPVFMR